MRFEDKFEDWFAPDEYDRPEPPTPPARSFFQRATDAVVMLYFRFYFLSWQAKQRLALGTVFVAAMVLVPLATRVVTRATASSQYASGTKQTRGTASRAARHGHRPAKRPGHV